MTGPAALASIVVKPASHPNGQAIPGCSTARLVSFGAYFWTSTSPMSANVSHPIKGPKA